MKRDEYLDKLTKENAKAEIENRVYEVCLLYEELEGKGKVRGNGHHMAQKVAKFASDLMEERWEKDGRKTDI
jgi:hypothetical protein